MNKSILLASLLATVALAACSKKPEEPKVEAPPAVVTPAPEAASAAASAVADAASSVADAAASAASK
ncbi:MAG: hypothetical protein EOP35_09960 [Rubrivivax sp.]|nr:MAG: hypothetical protein EOP35_09960 [Rubrivivax sp.]